MIEQVYDGSLEGLYEILEAVFQGGPLPDRIRRLPGSGFRGIAYPEPAERYPGICRGEIFPASPVQPELFEEFSPAPIPAIPRPSGFSPAPEPEGEEGSPAVLPGLLFEVSADASGAFIHAWMSELPVEGEIIRFGWRVLSAARDAGAGNPLGIFSAAARNAAGRISADRGDRGTEAVLKAAYKTSREIHRLLGLLRFSRDQQGRYLARCAPDHFILPALAAHFTRRFGSDGWAIIDERRGLTLLRMPGEEPRILPAEIRSPPDPGEAPGETPWEELWRNYHRSINNGDRKNPALQRQFMPARYWRYLPEMNFGGRDFLL
ncbi:MAG: TIGR03915 family putative DNA repair protein [Treponema sp.]|jgi:probable DNA metabolism protein|nr:TIGR03915 family putative DNA repair protein [Treponema sp.]